MNVSVYPHFPQSVNQQIDYMYSTTVLDHWNLRDNDNNLIIAGVDILNYIYDTYMNWKSQSPIDYLWVNYKTFTFPDFLKAWAAWQAEYNPLENYNGIETNVRQYMDGDETETITHGKTTTNSTGTDGIVTTTQVTTFDSTTPRDDTKTTNTGTTTATDSGTTTTGKVKTTKNLTVGETTYTADKIEAETNTRHGNLGLTTSQQMITSETEMRLNPLLMMYIDNFVHQYCYYVSDFWGCCE